MRYGGEVHLRFKGSKKLAKQYIPTGRVVLGELLNRDKELGGIDSSAATKILPNGVVIQVAYGGPIPIISINVPSPEGEEKLFPLFGPVASSWKEGLWEGRTDEDDIARHAMILGESDDEWTRVGKSALNAAFANSYNNSNAREHGVVDYQHESGHTFWSPIRDFSGPYSLRWDQCPEEIWWHNTLIYAAPAGYALVGYGIFESFLIVMEVLGDRNDPPSTGPATKAENDINVYSIPIALPLLINKQYQSPPTVLLEEKQFLYAFIQTRVSYGVANSTAVFAGVVDTNLQANMYPYASVVGSLWFNFSADGTKAIRCRTFDQDTLTGNWAEVNQPLLETRNGDRQRALWTRCFQEEFILGDLDTISPSRTVSELSHTYRIADDSTFTSTRTRSATNSPWSWTIYDNNGYTTATAGRLPIALAYDPEGNIVKLEANYPALSQNYGKTGVSQEDEWMDSYDYTVNLIYTARGNEYEWELYHTSASWTSSIGAGWTMEADHNMGGAYLVSNLSACDMRSGVFCMTQLQHHDDETFDGGPPLGVGEMTTNSSLTRSDKLVICRGGTLLEVPVPQVTTGGAPPIYYVAYNTYYPNLISAVGFGVASSTLNIFTGTFDGRPHGTSVGGQFPEILVQQGTLRGALGMPKQIGGINYTGFFSVIMPLTINPRGGVIAEDERFIYFSVLGYDLWNGPAGRRVPRYFRESFFVNASTTPWLLCGQSTWAYEKETGDFSIFHEDVLGVEEYGAAYDELIASHGGGYPHYFVVGAATEIADQFLMVGRLEAVSDES